MKIDLTKIEGYDQMTPNFRRETSVITYIRNNMSHDDLYTSVSAQVAWDDNDNSAGKLRRIL